MARKSTSHWSFQASRIAFSIAGQMVRTITNVMRPIITDVVRKATDVVRTIANNIEYPTVAVPVADVWDVAVAVAEVLYVRGRGGKYVPGSTLDGELFRRVMKGKRPTYQLV